MNYLKHFLALGIALAPAITYATPYFSIRSQGVNAVRELVGWQEFINRCSVEPFYGAIAATVEYTQSFRPSTIAQCLFDEDVSCGSPCGSTLYISGSRADVRGVRDWLADYFGLPTDFKSAIDFKPRIQNLIVDSNFYLGLDEFAAGLYARINLPIAWTRWTLNARERDITAGSNPYAPGYFTSRVDGVPRTNLLNQALDFFTGLGSPLLYNQDNTQVVFQKLACSKWAACQCSSLCKTALADIVLVFGYNILCTEDSHAGINIRVSGPTGNKPRGEFLFEPIVGNGGSWEVGGGLSTHAILWESEDSQATFSVYFDANITHLFKTNQMRCFDLCGQGPNSRYMLAQKMFTPSAPTLEGSDGVTTTPSTVEFANEFAPVANLTMSNVKVSAAVQGDLALKLCYNTGGGLSVDVGYNFWARSCEHICPQRNCSPTQLDGKTWALKGDAHVYGFETTTETPQALAPSEIFANIHTGTNGFDDNNAVANDVAITNPKIDNAQLALSSGTVLTATPGGTDQTHTSIQTIMLSEQNVAFVGTKGITNKLFAHISYAWLEHPSWNPFVGAGSALEFNYESRADCKDACLTGSRGSGLNLCCCSSCDCPGGCMPCAVSQWSVWIKGGLAF
jgi:hypothetical protein